MERPTRTHLLVMAPGDEVIERLMTFARERGIHAARFTAIGAFSSVTLGFFERDRKDYRKNALDEQVEACSLIGNISRFEGQPKVHCHAVIGRIDGTAMGGHLLEARVWPTLEVFLDELPVAIERVHEPEVGLALYKPGARSLGG